MTVDKSAAGRDTEYVGQTQQRMARIGEALECLRQGVLEAPTALIGPLEEQERASQQAHFAGIARLAHDMIACLQGALEVQRPLQTGTIDALSDSCQCIILHAEAVAAGVLSRSHRRAPAGKQSLPSFSAAVSRASPDPAASDS